MSISSTTLIYTKSFFPSFFNLTVVGIDIFLGEELFLFLIITTGDGTEPGLNSFALLFSDGYWSFYC
jgi:hypothetical protein